MGFVSVTVFVAVSLGAKLAQTEGKCSIARRLDTVALLHTCFPCHRAVVCTRSLLMHSRWLQVATKQSCMCHGSGARLSAFARGVIWRPSRSAAAAAVAVWQAGMATTLDDVAAADQTGNGRLFAANLWGNAHGNQW